MERHKWELKDMTDDTFAPLWSNIVYSSVWSMPKDVKILWTTMLAIKNRHGFVGMNIVGLARLAVLTLDECKAAMQVLTSPDENSTSKEEGGRRVMEVEGGWVIVNHQKYIDKMMMRREYNRKKQRDWRAKQGCPICGEPGHTKTRCPNAPSKGDAPGFGRYEATVEKYGSEVADRTVGGDTVNKTLTN